MIGTPVAAAVAAVLALGTPAPAAGPGSAAVRAPVTLWTASVLDGVAVALDVASGRVVGAPVPVEDPQRVAITPDGRTAWYSGSGGLDLTPVDVRTHTAGRPVTVLTFGAVAVSPDGSRVWVADDAQEGAPALQALDLRTGGLRAYGSGDASGRDVVLSPDGATAWLSGDDGAGTATLTAWTVTTGTARLALPLPGVGALTLSPDGATVWAATAAGVVPVDTATGRLGPAVPLVARDLAVGPAGDVVWAATPDGLVAIDTATCTAGPPVPGTAPAQRVELTPGGGRAYLQVDGALVPVDLAARRALPALDVPRPVFAVTPAQAPVAGFAARVSGRSAALDGSASAARTGRVVRWAWDFGDGTSAVTRSPRTQHTWARPGTYRVVLTVTDSSGTSTTRVWTGHQALRDGGPSARVAHPVAVR